jgi:hypothetical protein
MAALPSSFVSFKSRPYVPRSEAQPVQSGTHLRPAPSKQPAKRAASLFALAKEPEDAHITGGTRSLDRRLLALNLANRCVMAIEH